MGAAASVIGGNPIDEATQAKIQETTQEALKIFATEFTKAYSQAVVQKAKDEIEPEKSVLDDLKLQEAPVPAHVLKIGMLVKVSRQHICVYRPPSHGAVSSIERRIYQELEEPLLRRLQ